MRSRRCGPCSSLRAWVIALTLVAGGRLMAQTPADDDPIGPMSIRFYTGNLSFGLFERYFGIPIEYPLDSVNTEIVSQMRRISCSAMTDIICWGVVEPTEGTWDWSHYRGNAQALHDAELGYTPFALLHFPPYWYEESSRFVPYVNVATGESIPQLSLWSPDLANVYDQFYGRMAEEMGELVTFVRLPQPSEYGEVGYCSAMTAWLRPQPHAGPGYWCGDPYARADFRNKMLARFGSVDALNARWGTRFATDNDISMPETNRATCDFCGSAEARWRWIDFIDWYQRAWTESIEITSAIAKNRFPGKEIIISLGYPNETPSQGNDNGIHVETLGRLGLACQSPGAIGFYCTRRISSACRHYGVPYYTEPPADVPRDQELERIFMDISNGVQSWFDYMQNLDQSRDLFRAYKKHLTGARPVTSVAVWNSTVDHWLHPDQPFPKTAFALSDTLRDVVAYEIVDDGMIRTGALDSLGVKQLVLPNAQWLDAEAWQAVHAWVARGGVFIVPSATHMTDVAGDAVLWMAQVVDPIPVVSSPVGDIELLRPGCKPMGEGMVITLDCSALSLEEAAALIGALCENAGTWLDRPETNAKHVDNGIDGILTTRFEDKILYFNTGYDPQPLQVTFRPEDFPVSGPRPEAMILEETIPPRTIFEVRLTSEE